MIYLSPLYLVLFGFVLTGVIGLLLSWVDRLVTARVQYRTGPPVLQPLIDIVKLLGKETLIPRGASRLLFLAAPLTGLASVVAASTILWANTVRPGSGFAGDWILVTYLLTMPSMSIILGGFASASPYASLGASREMKMVVAYELPFVLAMLVPVLGASTTRLDMIVSHQSAVGPFAGSLSGFIALAVAVLCIQAKLALVPFDAPEAETEIVHGPLVEYSGSALAAYRLMKNMLLFTLPFLLTVMFWGGLDLHGAGIVWSLLKIVALVAVVTVIRNTNPRVRIDQAMKFFWGPVTILALAAVALQILGL